MIHNFLGNSFEFNSWFLSILTIFLLTTFLIFTCLWLKKSCGNLCPDRSFKGLEENEESYFNDISISTVPRVAFPLQPQVPSQNLSFDHQFEIPYSDPVTFEPLPKLTKRTTNKRAINTVDNVFGQLRPRIVRSGFKSPNGSVEIKNQLDVIKNISDGSFPRSQLQYIKELGVNKLAKVLQGEAYNMQPGRKRSQVTVVMIDASTHPSLQLTILQEALPYREVKHANVMRFFCTCTDTDPPLAIYESLKMGDLKTYLRSRRSEMQSLLNQGVILSMMCDVTAGLQALHQMDYVHRDLALRNCLLTKDMVLKIGDYGLSEQLYKDDYYYNTNDDEVGIPIRWMSPESLSFSYSLSVNDVTKEANIWTVGVVMWELLRGGDVPYPDLSNDFVIRLVAMERQVKPQRPLVVMDNIKYIYELMEMCWAYEVENRPTIRELKILLLHLASSKSSNEVTFNEKWNQLKPIIPSNLNLEAEMIGDVLKVDSDGKLDVFSDNADAGFNSKMERCVDGNTNNNNNNDADLSDSDLFDGKLPKLTGQEMDSTNNLSLAEELKLQMQDLKDNSLSHSDNHVANWVTQSHPSHDAELDTCHDFNILTPSQTGLNTSYATSYYDSAHPHLYDSAHPRLEDNSLLKMNKYNEYLQTVTTSLDEYDPPK